ncbi:MAG: ABC transporter permease subunit [Lachnospiraceae bacterium]|nr:ABC transporter permease subunit [Lachnospiraceae bacterium]
MVKYEIKKVFSRTSSKVALLFLLALLLFVSNAAVNAGIYADETGENRSGIAAARGRMEQKRQWAGTLDTERIQEVIRKNSELVAEQDAVSTEDVKKNNQIFHKKIGFLDIRQMLIYSFNDFNGYDYYLPDKLSPEDAAEFYPNRVKHLEEWLELKENEEQFSENEKTFLVEKYEELETPIQYEPADGWGNMFELMPMLIMITMLALGFLVAGIFSSEFQWKANAVLYSSYYGRSKAVSAKIKAGLLIVTVIYWAEVLLYSAIVLGVYGLDGMNCVIQISYWKSFYNITYGELYFLTIFGGYVGTVFLMLLCMLVSAKSKSAVVAVIVPFVLLFLPEFLRDALQGKVFNLIKGMLPDQLLQVNMIVRYFNLYEIGGRITGAVELLFPVYIVLSVLLCPVLYFVYKRAEVK